MEARLKTTPRVERNFSWHAATRGMIGSPTPFFKTAIAALAALAASAPCPIPSIAATKTPL
jgi:hypothetical protein